MLRVGAFLRDMDKGVDRYIHQKQDGCKFEHAGGLFLFWRAGLMAAAGIVAIKALTDDVQRPAKGQNCRRCDDYC